MVTSENKYAEITALLRAGLGGDQGAYGKFLATITPMLRRMVGRKLAQSDVEDVVQEILISIHKARHTYDGERPIMPWVASIASFRVTDHLRKHYSQMRHQSVDIADYENILSDVTGDNSGDESVNELLQDVPEKHKRILTLMHVEGYTAKEVGKQMGMNESAVKVAAHRAIKKIRGKVRYMTNTSDLIARLCVEAKPIRRTRTPSYWALRLLALLALYGVGCQFFLGFRPDLGLQLTRPLFAFENLLLLLLLLSSAVAAVLAMYPDAYQKPQLLKLPYAILALLVAAIGFQLLMPTDTRMVMPEEAGIHAMECAICIASVALIPSALIFALLRKGASVHPFQAGLFAVLSSSAIGCLTIRLAEANDSIMHLVQWHYVPTVLFAAVGALAGKWLLKW